MDNFKAVYTIHTVLEAAMDYPDFDMEQISAKALKVSDERWARYIEMMQDVGYIKGADIVPYVTGQTVVDCSRVRITLRGLEYLQENSIMRKLYKLAKGVKETVPGL